ncbi:MAG TPA: SRPBCC domain-containing protein [Gaiellaceae bacterium]|nr:SRPBCC domain-containing protein [Gaiellaceae bacterium]
MSATQVAPEAIAKNLVVKCSPERAFEVFTREIGSWWPMRSHLRQEIVAVVVEERVDGRVFERLSDGSEDDWGSVLVWEPPSRFAMSWYAGPDATRTELEVRFSADEQGTRVELEHHGWHVLGAGAEASRRAHDRGWDDVLRYYERHVNERRER